MQRIRGCAVIIILLVARCGLGLGDANIPCDGLVAWFDASTLTNLVQGQAVQSWTKRQGKTGVDDYKDWNFSDQYAPVYQSARSDFNNRPCLYFSEQVRDNDYLVSSNMVSGYLSGKSVTVIFVSKSPCLGVLNFLSPRLYFAGNQLTFGSTTVSTLGLGSTSNTAIRAYVVDAQGKCAEGWLNGVLKNILDLSAHPGSDFSYGSGRGMRIGSSAIGSIYSGYMAEVLIYDRVLTPVEMNDIGYYLQNKYGIQGSYKKPFKVLYINDNTNVYNCDSPFNTKGDPFTDSQLRYSVAEVAGKVDVHMLECYGWIPWWKSSVYSGKSHYERWQQRTGGALQTMAQYVINDGDVIETFIDECRETDQSPFISFRLNDTHYLNYWDPALSTHANTQWISDFLWDNIEYRLGSVVNDTEKRKGLNWAYPHVRNHKLDLIREICEKYDIEGIELDFMRHEYYFKTNETTLVQRETIMASFVSSVREILDETGFIAEKGHRWLCVRIPCLSSRFGDLGINIQKFRDAGVDMFNLSATVYTTQQDTDLTSIKNSLPREKVYFELTPMVWSPKHRNELLFENMDGNATDPHLRTAAMKAYNYGADGISLYNFAYYRGASMSVTPYSEPPFDVIPDLGDLQTLLSKNTHWYFLADNYSSPQMSASFTSGLEKTFQLDVMKTSQVAGRDCLLRFISAQNVNPADWTATVNQNPVSQIYPILKPIPDQYKTPLGRSSQYLCFEVPIGFVSNGVNYIKLKNNSSGTNVVDVHKMDLVIAPNLYSNLSLKAWYKADSVKNLANGATVSQWSNSWGQATDWITYAGSPKYYSSPSGFGGKPAIDIDGVTRGDRLKSLSFVSDFLDNKELTVFTVTKGRYLGLHNSGIPRLYMRGFNFTIGDPEVTLSMPDSSNDTSVKIYRLSKNPTNGAQAVMMGWINNVSQGSAVTALQDFGGNGDLYMPFVSGGTGTVAEVIIYNKALSYDQVKAVGFYLADKYNLNTGWAAPTNTQYFNIEDIPIMSGHN